MPTQTNKHETAGAGQNRERDQHTFRLGNASYYGQNLPSGPQDEPKRKECPHCGGTDSHEERRYRKDARFHYPARVCDACGYEEEVN